MTPESALESTVSLFMPVYNTALIGNNLAGCLSREARKSPQAVEGKLGLNSTRTAGKTLSSVA